MLQVLAEISHHAREAPPSMMHAQSPTDVEGRDGLPVSRLPCRRGQKHVN